VTEQQHNATHVSTNRSNATQRKCARALEQAGLQVVVRWRVARWQSREPPVNPMTSHDARSSRVVKRTAGGGVVARSDARTAGCDMQLTTARKVIFR
jgi:hypothetical protein